ncbi:MAG: quinohemoprotein amine dehydrogenase maturation protein [Lautropia sp.]|nr:quinohemoprotein amine dehydrogenase maturation protein [Lautropia sp.]
MEDCLTLVENNVHEPPVQAGQPRMLFHVPTTALFTLDPAVGRLLDTLRAGPCDREQLQHAVGPAMGRAELDETLNELLALEVISDGRPLSSDTPVSRVSRTALNTLVLNVNTGCNLSCTYCYKEDLDTPSQGRRMEAETAEAAVEMLLRESPDEKRYTVVFFGGEPLSNRPLIEHMVDYCERRFAQLGKVVDFVMTTNATLLTDRIIDYLDEHRFGLSISMDGPRHIHDLNRRTVMGRGSYDLVRRKVDNLLKRYRSRPVGVRVTLTAGVTDVEGIWRHLFHEVGFAEVGFAPVTSGALDTFNLSNDDLQAVFDGFKRLGQHYVDEALAGRSIGFSNLHQLIGDLHEGNRKALPCGAGLKMLAVDRQGDLHLCHRFTGSSMPTFGNVQQGVDTPALTEFLSQRLDRSGTGCASCRIRNLCAGGCYHESHARYGDPTRPTYHYCELMRDWIDFGLQAYSRIRAQNPAFIDQFITPRHEPV